MTDVTQSSRQARRAEKLAVAGQWRLFWLKFRKHRLAMVSLVVIVLLYAVAALAPFLAPADPNGTNARFTYAPPQGISLFYEGEFRPTSLA